MHTNAIFDSSTQEKDTKQEFVKQINTQSLNSNAINRSQRMSDAGDNPTNLQRVQNFKQQKSQNEKVENNKNVVKDINAMSDSSLLQIKVPINQNFKKNDQDSSNMDILINSQSEIGESFIYGTLRQEQDKELTFIDHFIEPILYTFISPSFLSLVNDHIAEIQGASEKILQIPTSDQERLHSVLAEKTRILEQKVETIQSIIKKNNKQADVSVKQTLNGPEVSLDQRRLQIQQGLSYIQTKNKVEIRRKRRSEGQDSLTHRSKVRTQKGLKRRTPKQLITLSFSSNQFNYTLDERKQFETERNPYIKEVRELKQKIRRMEQERTNQNIRKQPEKKSPSISLQRGLNQSQSEDFLSRISQKRSYVGKIMKVDDITRLISPPKQHMNEEAFRIKKVHQNIHNSHVMGQTSRNFDSQKDIKEGLNSVSIIPIVNSESYTQQIPQIIQDYDITSFDLEITALPQGPKFSDTQFSLINLAKQTFKIFGIKITVQTETLNIKKFKNCVLFIINEDNTIVWHFEGRFYCGGWQIKYESSQKNGFGYEYVPQKYAYRGEFRNNKRQGQGTIKMINGTVYSGDWHQGIKHGFGKQRDQAGIYEGRWKDGMREGHGRIILFDQQAKSNHKYSFEGQFVKGLKNGYGIQYFQNGDQYRGQYFNGKLHGKGLYIWATDAHYDGQFRQGMRHGRGLWKSPRTMDFYEGEYTFNKKNGYGTYKWGDGSQYTGYFENDTQNGEGIFTDAEGIVKECLWKDGKAVKQIRKILSKKKLIRPQEKQKQNQHLNSQQNQSSLKHLKNFKSIPSKQQNSMSREKVSSTNKFRSTKFTPPVTTKE